MTMLSPLLIITPQIVIPTQIVTLFCTLSQEIIFEKLLTKISILILELFRYRQNLHCEIFQLPKKVIHHPKSHTLHFLLDKVVSNFIIIIFDHVDLGGIENVDRIDVYNYRLTRN